MRCGVVACAALDEDSAATGVGGDALDPSAQDAGAVEVSFYGGGCECGRAACGAAGSEPIIRLIIGVMFKAAYACVFAIALFVGCGSVKARSDGDGGLDGNADGNVDGRTACTSNAQCSGDMPVCDTVAMACGACSASDIGVCTGTAPICGSDDACHPCAAHSECASSVCMPDGSCGAESLVAYVDASTGAGSTCTRTSPCATIAQALATTRAYVKIHGAVDEALTLTDRNVTFLSDPDAILLHSGSAAITINGSSHVAIYDLTITSSFQGINVPTGTTVSLVIVRSKITNHANGGIVMESGTLSITGSTIASNTGAGGMFSHDSTVTVTTSTFSGNGGGEGISLYAGSLTVSRSLFTSNINGGISVGPTGTFAIVGNVFYGNGQIGSSGANGGIKLNTAENAANRLELNSFVANKASTSIAGGIQCTAGTFTARNNIMLNNTGTTTQFSGTCLHAYTISRPGNIPTGTGNLGIDPMFVSESTGDLHLKSTSGARGVGDPATSITGIAALDMDGDMRAVPPDIGADQFAP